MESVKKSVKGKLTLAYKIAVLNQKGSYSHIEREGCEDLKVWIKPCENHLYWSAMSTYDGNGQVIWAKFKSFLSHITDKHDDLDDPLFNKCLHGPIPHRTWLRREYVDEIYQTFLSSSREALHIAADELKTMTPEPMNSMLEKEPKIQAVEKHHARKRMSVLDVPPTMAMHAT
ncbi:hypothetical protein QZH41_014257, partial [Actinostola sp. cb2023]